MLGRGVGEGEKGGGKKIEGKRGEVFIYLLREHCKDKMPDMLLYFKMNLLEG